MANLWIKTADRVPSSSSRVLFWDGEIIELGYYDDGLFWIIVDIKGGENMPERYVPYWMPLPEPPEEN